MRNLGRPLLSPKLCNYLVHASLVNMPSGLNPIFPRRDEQGSRSLARTSYTTVNDSLRAIHSCSDHSTFSIAQVPPCPSQDQYRSALLASPRALSEPAGLVHNHGVALAGEVTQAKVQELPRALKNRAKSTQHGMILYNQEVKR